MTPNLLAALALPEVGWRLQGDASAWACTSEDDRYRYLLGRTWARGLPIFGWCLVNPSIARHNVRDPTLGKVCEFSKRAGAGGVVLGNLFAWSATDPREMERAWSTGADIVGPCNLAALRWILKRAQCELGLGLISAWGKLRPRLQPLAAASRNLWESAVLVSDQYPESAGTMCLGTNLDGSPRHPLMLPYSTRLVPYGRGSSR